MRVRRIGLAWMVAMLASCGGSQAAPPRRDEPAARAYLTRLERRLMAATSVHVHARLRSTPPFRADVHAGLDLGRGNEARLSFGGEVGGELLNASLVSDGTQMRRRLARRDVPDRVAEGVTPRALRQSLVLGLTRMGLLHNVVRLAGFELPDHAEGGAAEWVRLRGFTARLPERVRSGGDVYAEIVVEPVELEVVVSGEPVAEAILWFLDELPYRRVQRVRFPQGRMDVHEEYTDFEVDGTLARDRFVLGPAEPAPEAAASPDAGGVD